MTAKISKNDQGKKDHLILVEKGIYFLKKNKFNKVVLSRKEVIKIDGFDFKSVFKNLLSNYPYAFNYIWFHSEIGMWMGASPETLIKTNRALFEPLSLAGTKFYKGSLAVYWDNKRNKSSNM
jgi:isochorismate synthase